MGRGGARPGAGRKKKEPGAPFAAPMRLTALGPPRERAVKAREHALEFLDTREDALIEEVWTIGTLRDRLELYRFLKPYAHGVAKLPADQSTADDSFEGVMKRIAAEQMMKRNAVTTSVETMNPRLGKMLREETLNESDYARDV